MKILALDLAKSKSVSLLLDTDVKQEDYRTIPTTPFAVGDLIERTRPDRVVLEVGAAAGWVHDIVLSKSVAVEVANPSGEAWRWCTIKSKTDRKDAYKLAYLSSIGQLPKVHVPVPQVRQKRALIGYYRKLVERRTAIKCQIHAILQRQGLPFVGGKGYWSQQKMAQLRQWACPLTEVEDLELWRGQLDLELKALDQIEEQVLVVERKLNALGKQDKKVQLLQTIPGVGPRLSEALVAVIDDPHRFKSAKQVSSYLGMVPRLYESGQLSRNGHITHAGNSMLRSLLVEVSWLGLRWNSHLAAIYKRVRGDSKSRSKVAIVAVARHLLVIAWAMLRDNRPWRPPAQSQTDKTKALATVEP